jgi:hypothetical protein
MKNDDGTVIIILNPPTHAVVNKTISVGPVVQMPSGMTKEQGAKLLREAAHSLEKRP